MNTCILIAECENYWSAEFGVIPGSLMEKKLLLGGTCKVKVTKKLGKHKIAEMSLV